jgi:choline dehydrogenase-like flavoprotein
MSDDLDADVVIVGAGISCAILAKELTAAGKRVLVLEAGTDLARTWAGYNEQIATFRGAPYKTAESPYKFNPNAPEPDPPGVPTPGGDYFVQKGKANFRSTYARAAGGTTLHWMGTALRMLPEDFKLKTNFQRGRDWPIGYDDLSPYYNKAEWEIGVAGDVAEQTYNGVTFSPASYTYPMRSIPKSWIDQTLAKVVDTMTIPFGGEQRKLRVRAGPQGRNSTPTNDSYEPVGAVDLAENWGPRPDGQRLARDIGERCQGNTNCTPICPVQAKYNALKTLSKATATGRAEVRTRCVASKVLVDGAGRVTGIQYLRYTDPNSPRHTTEVATGQTYVLACHAIENPKLMLNSGLVDKAGLIGKCLIDHPEILAWGLMPKPTGVFRGPLCGSGMEELRKGAFRANFAAFRMEIGNDGWLWPVGAPESVVQQAVQTDLFGPALRNTVGREIAHQFRVGMLIEQLPDTSNTVTIDASKYKDPLGLPRPIITYDIDDYTRAGMAASYAVAEAIFTKLGAQNKTDPTSKWLAIDTVDYQGKKYAWDSAGHIAATHLMGPNESSSVVDSYQRHWAHPNLFLVGSGSMPTMGAANPTLTLSALAFRTAEEILLRPDGRDRG